MADMRNSKTTNKEKKKTKKRKLEKSSEEDEEGKPNATDFSEESDQVLKELQDISRCFGVGGLFGNYKKRKIESHGGKVSLLEDWLSQETVRSLSSGHQQRYMKEMSSEVLALLQQLKKLLIFVKRLHGIKGNTAQNKDLVLDVLLKDIKVNPSLSIPERYCQMGLWNQVLEVNQRLPTMLEEAGVTDATQEFDGSSEKRLTCSAQKDGDPPEAVLDESEVSGRSVQSFRDFYMDVVTSSFANDLDGLRKDESFDSKQVSALIDCLETGKDIWTDLEKSLLQNSVAK